MENILGVGSITISDLNDAIISGDAPRNPDEGALWIDSSANTPVLKVYKNGSWQPQEIDVTNLDPELSETVTTIVNTLGTLANDGLLTYSDRLQLSVEIASIIGEIPSKQNGNVYPNTLPAYNIIDSRGVGSFSNLRQTARDATVPTDNTYYIALEQAYTELNTYLSSLTPRPWDVTLTNKDNNTEVANPDTYREALLNYYLAEMNLATYTEKRASDAAKEYTDASISDAITSVDVEYATSTDSTTVPDDDKWNTLAPTWSNGIFIWSRTLTTYKNGSTYITDPVNITGAKGESGGTGTPGRSITKIEEEYYHSDSATQLTGGRWSETRPEWKDGKFIWTRSTITFANPSGEQTTDPISVTGAKGEKGDPGSNAPTIKLSGDSQMIKQDASGNVTPSTSFNITGVAVNTTITRWLFSVNGGAFGTGLTTGVTRSGNVVTINPERVTFNTLSIRAEDGTVTDTFTIGRAVDGEKGAKGDKGDEGLDGIDAITVVLTNESHTFAGGTTNAIAGSASTEFLAFKGANRASVTIGDITGMPEGMTRTIDTNNSQNAKVTFNVTTAMKSRSGIVTIPLTVDGKIINKTFSYSLSLKGDKGESGERGPRGLEGQQGPEGKQGIQGPEGKDGLHSYTHIAYASGSTGQGFNHSSFADATHIGMYVSNDSDSSEDWEDYEWTLIKGKDGSQGLRGPEGKDGLTPYFHTAWANNSTGTSGFSTTDSLNKLYIGTYTSFESDDSEEPSDYKWTKIKGDKGDKGDEGTGVKSAVVAYRNHTSGTATPPTTGWVENPPTPNKGQYMWTRTITTYTDNSNITTYSVAYNAIDGGDGKGITSTTVSYAISTSGSTTPTNWVPTRPTPDQGDYMWTRTVIKYTDGTESTAYNTSYSATDGQKGDKGDKGEAGKGIHSQVVTYQNHSNGTTAPTGSWSDNPSPVKGQYLWTRTVTQYTEGNPITTYAVAYNALDGQRGAPGATGGKGDDGTDGTGISSTVIRYFQSASGTTPPTGSGATSPPTPIQGQYNWTRTEITYTDGTKSTAWSTSYNAQDGKKGDKGDKGDNAPLVKLSGTTQIITQSNTGVRTPSASFTVVGTPVNTTISSWTYSVNGGTFGTGLPTGVTRSGNTVTIAPGSITFNTLSIKATGGGVSDTFTIARIVDGDKGAKGDTGSTGGKGTDGKDGADAITVLLSNESHTFQAGTTNAIAGSTTTDIHAYKGTNKIAVTVGTITGMPTGMTRSVSNSGTVNARVTFTVATNMTSPSGTVIINLTVDGKPIVKEFSYALTFKGDKGDKGDKGATGSQGPRGLTGLQGPEGKQGIKGDTGSSGVSSYTHIAYATGDQGQSFNHDTFPQATYIGMYVSPNQNSSGNWRDYEWTLIKGDRGEQGLRGPVGNDGKTPYFHVAWANNATGSSGFSRTVSAGKLYIGTYTSFDSNPPAAGTYNWTLIKGDKGAKGDKGDKGDTGSQGPRGAQGPQGIQGPTGNNGQSQYVHIRYSANSNGNPNQTNPSSSTKYIGVAVTSTSGAPGYASFNWSKYIGDDGGQGPQGPQGIRGPVGPNGQPTYTWVRYADTPTSGINANPAGKKYIGLSFNQTSATPTNTYALYQWSLMPQNIEIGGRNLLTDSTFEGGGSGWTRQNGVIEYADGLLITSGSPAELYRTNVLNDLDTATVSVWVKGNGRFQARSGGGTRIGYTAFNHDTFKQVSSTFDNMGNGNLILMLDGDNLEVERVKLEKGNTATDWSEAPEDTDKKITDGMEEVSTAVNAAWTTEAESIRGDVEATYVTANDFATLQTEISTSFTQTEEAFDFRFNEAEKLVSEAEGNIETLENEIKKYIRFVDGSIILGAVGSTSEVIITNEKISFMQGGDSPVAFIEGQEMQINHGIFVDSATIAGFKFELVQGTTEVLGITWTDN